MLNGLIRIDLHIHSKASSYKDKGVDLSACDAGHVDVLLDKLAEAENSIDMFSVTDHNRFDAALYEEFYKRIDERGFNIHLLSGVEFDVELQEGKPAAHVITIFNAKDSGERKMIQSTIEQDGLIEDESGFYTIDDFESLLRHVGLSAILIVHQHAGFGGSQRKRSAGSASDDAVKLYQYGFSTHSNTTTIEFKVSSVGSLRIYGFQLAWWLAATVTSGAAIRAMIIIKLCQTRIMPRFVPSLRFVGSSWR